jgi:acetylglutamate kinase
MHNGHAAGRLRPLVVKLGGAAIEQGCERTFAALARLHAGEPGGVVLVHGGGKAVDRRFARLGLKSQRKQGVRITPPEHIEELVAVLAGVVNTAVVGGLQRHGAAAVGLCLGDGFFATASKSDKFGFDAGRVGVITGGSPALVSTLLAAGFLPALSSVALDERGEALNINADEAAAGVAGILGARALILLTDTPGILDASGNLIRSLTDAEAEARIEAGEITNGMIPKVRGAAIAARAAGAPAWIASAADPENLGRLARGEGEGTRVLPEALGSVGELKGGAVFARAL